MRKLLTTTAVFFIGVCALGAGKLGKDDPKSIPAHSTVYIESNGGFDVYVTKAIDKKKIPLTVVTDKEKAEFVISVDSEHGQRTTVWHGIGTGLGGQKHGPQSVDEAAMKVVNRKTGAIVLTHEVRKTNAIRGKQSAAESLVKRLNDSIPQ